MFVVAPTLSTNPAIYGIYMLCVSLNIFLAYADIGFINAGFKYAAEYYSKGELVNEMKVVGFVIFILAVFLVIPFALFLVLSFNPELLISDIGSEANKQIATRLLLIQSVFSFNVLMGKYNQIVYGVRLKNDKINQVSIVANLIKIVSIAYFFRNGTYDIVGYFLFGKIVETIGYVINTALTPKYFNYNILLVLKFFRFSKPIFQKTKSLAIVSFVGTLFWILYNELDSIAITKFLGVETFAFFAVGMTFSKFVRSLFAVIFMPFNARFNHFLGQNRPNELKEYFFKLLNTIFPIITLFVFTIIFLRKPLILSWVGQYYTLSVEVLLFLMLAMIFTTIRNLSVSLANALEKIRLLYTTNIVLLLSYVFTIVLFFKSSGLLAFAYAKFVSALISNILFIFVISKEFETKLIHIVLDLIRPLILPIFIIFISSLIFNANFKFYKSSSNLFIVILIGGFIYLISLILLYFTSSIFKRQVKSTIIGLRNKIV